uniref:Dedicator of cytokinesis protein 4 n=1 Tax=Sphaerodactylus townsendi TaxID=933632 RepID=A0ACB8FPL5_9SAUR
MCASILSNIFCFIKKNGSEKSLLEEIDIIVNSLLDILLKTILEITSRPQSAGSAMRFQFQDVTDFLLQIFTVFRILLQPEMFPKDWTVMRLVANNVIITTVLYLSDALRKNFLNESFDYKIWDSYFYLAVIFINQLCLQLEMFTSSKKKKVLEKYGDMRVTMGCEIFSMWQNLGELKVHFIPALIGPFLEVTLIPQPDLRNVMIPIFHDMMDWEQRRSGNFKQVEAKLIDKLDSLMSEGKGDETYRELFNSMHPPSLSPPWVTRFHQEKGNTTAAFSGPGVSCVSPGLLSITPFDLNLLDGTMAWQASSIKGGRAAPQARFLPRAIRKQLS